MTPRSLSISFQGQIVTPVVQNQQAGVDGSRSSDRHIGNVVYGFVYGSIGVQVLTEFHPDTLQVFASVHHRGSGSFH